MNGGRRERRFAKPSLLAAIARRQWSLPIAVWLPAIVVIALVGYAVWQAYDTIRRSDDRVRTLDAALKNESPGADSAYCQRIFSSGAEHARCAAAERLGYRQFARAWERGRGLGTVRDQLLRCYLEGHQTEGLSWAAAAHCAEADMAGLDPTPGK